MKVLLAPWEAFAMAVRMNKLEKAEVDRARQVAMVKGLNRNLPWSAPINNVHALMITLQ
jgi:hypothetical protein